MITKAAPRDQIDQAINTTLNALRIQKKGFQLTAENMANADTVAKPGQKPYQKKVVIITEKRSPKTQQLTQKAQIKQVSSPGKKVYDPGHPYADSNGYKTVSNVNATQEMVNALTYRENIDRLTRLHKMGYDLKRQDLDLLGEK